METKSNRLKARPTQSLLFLYFISLDQNYTTGVRIKSQNLKSTMFKILVPVDLTDDSITASYYALSLATAAPQAQILLLHCYQDYLADSDDDVVPPFKMTASEEITERILYRNINEAQDQLEKLYQQLRAKAATRNINTHLERTFMHGLPEDVILDEAKRFKPNLVVMGTKGEPNIARSFFGTVTTKMVHDLSTPILTVPNTHQNGPIAKVAYAACLEKEDATSIIQLMRLLQPQHPEIHCVHVAKNGNAPQTNESLQKLQHTIQETFPDASINYAILKGDSVSDTLKTFLQEQQINLLALTTHKRSLIGNLLHPSLTQKLILDSKVPLLIFHTSG